MRIGTCTSRPGQIGQGIIPMAREGLPDLPVVIVHGAAAGPTAFLSAGVHGDELTGVATVERLRRDLDPAALGGAVVLLPQVNVAGCQARQRGVPPRGEDLNRAFPGDPSGSPAQRLAHAVFTRVLSRCDFGVDVHDAGPGSVYLPHARAHILVGDAYDPGRLAAIARCGADLIMLTRGMPGVMTLEACLRLGLPAFTLEVGGGPEVLPDFAEVAAGCLRNLLVAHQMLPGPLVLPAHQYVLRGADDLQVRARLAGRLACCVRLGQSVAVGQGLVEVVDPATGRRQQVVAERCGLVHELRPDGPVAPGDDLVAVLPFERCPERGVRPALTEAQVIDNHPGPGVRLRSSTFFDAASLPEVNGISPGGPESRHPEDTHG